MVNVDLSIKDELNRTLLTWRDDGYCAPGWYVPGGIIRFKEPMTMKIRRVALDELGAEVEFDPAAIDINEIIEPKRKTRGHFASLLFACRFSTPSDERLRYVGESPLPGQWMRHEGFPENIIDVHKIYRRHFFP